MADAKILRLIGCVSSVCHTTSSFQIGGWQSHTLEIWLIGQSPAMQISTLLVCDSIVYRNRTRVCLPFIHASNRRYNVHRRKQGYASRGSVKKQDFFEISLQCKDHEAIFAQLECVILTCAQRMCMYRCCIEIYAQSFPCFASQIFFAFQKCSSLQWLIAVGNVVERK